MKKYILFTAILCLFGCKTTLFLGENKDGYLSFNDAIYRGSKENIGNIIEQKEKFIPEFNVPSDIFLNFEHQQFDHKLQKGIGIYRRNIAGFHWDKVGFIPPNQKIKEISCSKDTVSVSVKFPKDNSIKELKYYFREGNSNFQARYILLSKK